MQKVAELARLKLSDAEAEAIAGQLAAVLENFEQLAMVQTTGVEPLVTPTDVAIHFREDKAAKEFDIESFMVNAPSRSGRLFKVPPVV